MIFAYFYKINVLYFKIILVFNRFKVRNHLQYKVLIFVYNFVEIPNKIPSLISNVVVKTH